MSAYMLSHCRFARFTEGTHDGMRVYVPRETEPVLRECVASFASVVITGPRQSGKTTLVRQVLPRYRYVSLDDPLLRSQAETDPELLLGNPDEPVILDEIQHAPSLLTYVKRRIDERRDTPGRFLITGSQQFAVMRGVTESLAGRAAALELLPFTLGEASVLRPYSDAASPAEAFVSACLSGLCPEPLANPGMAADGWQSAYVQTYLERDVRVPLCSGSSQGVPQRWSAPKAELLQVTGRAGGGPSYGGGEPVAGPVRVQDRPNASHCYGSLHRQAAFLARFGQRQSRLRCVPVGPNRPAHRRRAAAPARLVGTDREANRDGHGVGHAWGGHAAPQERETAQSDRSSQMSACSLSARKVGRG